ncbi:hypothetical protein BJ166DRAFT_495524 [Pestalotiopsis sp. NC0098]|nr:hypothetical protein BJ166DRAFT_495524 [Pestalotiopsis sp. NC0098]
MSSYMTKCHRHEGSTLLHSVRHVDDGVLSFSSPWNWASRRHRSSLARSMGWFSGQIEAGGKAGPLFYPAFLEHRAKTARVTQHRLQVVSCASITLCYCVELKWFWSRPCLTQADFSSASLVEKLREILPSTPTPGPDFMQSLDVETSSIEYALAMDKMNVLLLGYGQFEQRFQLFSERPSFQGLNHLQTCADADKPRPTMLSIIENLLDQVVHAAPRSLDLIYNNYPLEPRPLHDPACRSRDLPLSGSPARHVFKCYKSPRIPAPGCRNCILAPSCAQDLRRSKAEWSASSDHDWSEPF